MPDMSPVTALWTRLLAANDPSLSAELAKHFLSIGFTEAETERLQTLAAKDRRDLSTEELAEFEALVHASTALTLLQSKARLSLKKRNPAA